MTDGVKNLAGKVYIVTGASRGVGIAICRALDRRGARIALLARTAHEIEAHASGFGERALAVPCDVGDRQSINAAVAKVADHFGAIDGLINNAGIARISPVERLSDEDLLLMFRINVLGTVGMIQEVLPHLRKQGGGNIVNISSTSVRYLDEFPFLGGYSAVKAALERLTEELRAETIGENIAVTLFSLGSTLTHFGTGWEPGVTGEAFVEWSRRGGMAPATMDPAYPAEAVVRCLESPPGCCADFIQFRPHAEQEKGPAMAS